MKKLLGHKLNLIRGVDVPGQGLPAVAGWQEEQDGGGKPLFCWDHASLITLSEINWILSVILDGEEPKSTTKAFRPALPTILARQGASEEALNLLGRWTSCTYLHYVREGRSADWQGLLKKLRNLRI
jgi:hypothetical protein